MRGEPVEKYFCPECNAETVSRVLETRGIRRRRECVECGRTFTTREIEDVDPREEPHHRPLIDHPALPF